MMYSERQKELVIDLCKEHYDTLTFAEFKEQGVEIMRNVKCLMKEKGHDMPTIAIGHIIKEFVEFNDWWKQFQQDNKTQQPIEQTKQWWNSLTEEERNDYLQRSIDFR